MHALARDGLARAVCRGGVPALVAGDLNRTLHDLPCAHAFVANGWADLASDPTSLAANAHVCKRIDLLLANPQLRRVAQDIGVDVAAAVPAPSLASSGSPRLKVKRVTD